MKEANFNLKDICEMASAYEIKNIYVFSHIKHDGDAKGASLALVEYFKNKGFNSKYIITNIDTCLVNIFGVSVEVTKSINERFFAVSLDTSTSSGCENNLYKKAEKIFKIDHHCNSELFGDFNWINETASSTCEMVASLIDEKELNPKMATSLYIGIYTDTGSFRHDVSENLFLQLAKLVKCGADTVHITENMKYTTRTRKKIEGLVALKNKKYAEGLIGSVIKKERYFDPLSVAKAVSILKNIEGRLYFCACEAEDGKVFVELQSSHSSDIDVSEYARKFTGGGGHIHSAGFTLDNISELNKVIDDLRDLVV